MSSPTFEERAPHEQAFARVFDDQILPLLLAHQGERDAARRKGRRWAALVGALGLGAACAVLVFVPSGPVLIAALPAIALTTAGMAVAARRGPRAAFDHDMAQRIGPILCEVMDIDRFEHRVDLAFLDPHPFRDLRLVDWFDGVDLQDGLDGAWRGVRYRMVEARLTRRRSQDDRRSGQHTVNVFRGLLMRIETPRDMPTILFLRARRGVLGWLRGRFARFEGMERLPFPDPEVEAAYDTYASDVETARTVITPAFGRTLLALRHDLQGGRGHLAAAFQGRHLYLAVHRKEDFLRLGAADLEPAAFAARCRAALADLMIPRRVIDTLVGAGGEEL
ncbi:DUF3137 domain-containing protein [uncultured Rhodospira sp.]|uniref:DUF3137 domain-containing protein n=1 Tax=uncultured Rhodospira sp. TaxID=1936189 RepID=UPI0026176947|nr:DUF3137 domain-containing protein [uncultured Rhodospira sp.]